MTSPDVNLRTGMLYSVTSLMAKVNAEQYAKVYYVNNIDGSDTLNNGLSKIKPFAQVSKAITAWEAYRLAQANVNVRGLIYVYGTITSYTELTAMPNYCDMVGLGANPRGNGTGIARIGPDADGIGAVDGVKIATGMRGTNLFNLQFQAGTAKACLDVDIIYRSGLYNCALMANNDANNPTHGLKIGKASGLTIDGCHWGGASATDFDHGIEVTGTHFHNCEVKNSHITGIDSGVEIAAGCTSSWMSWFKENYIGTGLSACAIGVNDAATTGHIVYCGNYVRATNPNVLANDHAGRWIGNIVANAFEAGAAT